MLTSLDPRVLRARAWEQAVRPLALIDLPHAPLGRGSALACTGRRRPDLNTALVSGAAAPADIERAVAAFGDLPAVFMVPEPDAPRVVATAERLGLTDAGSAPLMTMTLDASLAEAPTAGVERAGDAATAAEGASLLAEAFALEDGDWLRGDLPAAEGVDIWLLREARRAVSALVATGDPDLLGIWAMGTPPGCRGRGYAARLLRAVLGHHALEGVDSAFLVATAEGEPLYRSVGFETAEHWQLWMKP
jgi:GNAT superfamily N-acetyltransferase